ncbi:MAG TPA: ferric reductase-like transmembrane domain-containing protein [Thermoanaerobaculia bacterium]|nr:ferric reductase-like transmembrane domain-containing protein [Thermoanaerobaculia bacterium]
MNRFGYLTIASLGYAILAVTPLLIGLAPPRPAGRAFLVELSIALGFIAFAQMGLQLGLIGRFQRMSRPLGIDLVMQYHRQIGILALVVVVAHPVLLILHQPAYLQFLNPFGGTLASRTGVFSILALIVLTVTSVWRKQLRIGYEAWRVTHALLGIGAILLAQIHIYLLGVFANAPWKQGALALWSLVFIGLIVWLRLVKPVTLRRRSWQVLEVLPEAPTTWTVVLEPRGHDGFRFAPGQFAWIKIGNPWSVDEHPFSFSSSAERPDRLELGIKELGDFTNRIGEVEPGTPVYIDGPHGSFSSDFQPADGFLFIAGGIGISPILSMLRTLADRSDRRSHVLVYACSRWSRTAFRDELGRLSARLDLKMVYVFEEPHEGWTGASGYVDGEILAPLLRRDQSQHVLMCGPDAMMTAVEKALYEQGVPDRRIHMERFNLV